MNAAESPPPVRIPNGPDAGDDAVTGWVRALVSGLAVLVVGFGGTVVGANAILTDARGLTREARVGLATGLFLVVLALLAWVLRRLQQRKLI